MSSHRMNAVAAAMSMAACTMPGSYRLERYHGHWSDIGARCAADCKRRRYRKTYLDCLDACPGVTFHAGVVCAAPAPPPDCPEECHARTSSRSTFEACLRTCEDTASTRPEPEPLCETARRVDTALTVRAAVLGTAAAVALVGGGLLVLYYLFAQGLH